MKLKLTGESPYTPVEFLAYWRGWYAELCKRKNESRNGYLKRMALRGQVRALIDMERKGA